MKLREGLTLVCSLCLLFACGGGGSSSGNSSSAMPPPQSLVITSAALPNGTAGTPYAGSSSGFSLTASGGIAPYQWSWAAAAGSALPPGLSLANASVSGTPTAAGSYKVIVTVTDSESPSAHVTANYAIVVAAAAFAITSGAPPSGTVGKAYDFRCSQIPLCNVFLSGFPLNASGGVQPYVWTWAAAQGSSLPPGLGLSSRCLNFGGPAICGTPTMSGSYNVVVTASDSESPPAQASALYTITILSGTAAADPVPLINQPLNPDALLPSATGFTLTVSGTGFVPSSLVYWNGSPRATSFVSKFKLRAAILGSDIAIPSTASVTVVNSSGAASSNVAFFEATNPSSWAALGPPARFATGAGPSSLASGDFNGDHKLDLAVANTNSNNISFLPGKGDGTFEPAVNYSVGSSPSSLTVGDFNNDGKPDLAVANNGSNNVSILLGNGDGTFQAAVEYNAGQNPSSLAVGDFNGDGKLDLAVTNIGSSNVAVLLGNGDGTFQPPVGYNVEQNPVSVVVGDFNGDDVLDLAVADNASNSVSILLGNGDGTFQKAIDYGGTQNPASVVVGDLNGDGKLDLAVSNSLGYEVSVLLGNGDGSFQPPVNYRTGGYEPSLALGDLNGDGKLDLAVADIGSSDVTVLVGKGDGTFQPTVNYSTGQGASTIALGDFNGDGKLDLAIPDGASAVSILLQSVPLSGPNATLSTTRMFFECRNVIDAGCQCITGGTATLSNFGSQTLNITGTKISGPFSEVNNCGASLESGRSCAIDVTWLEKQGSGGGLLSFTDNASGSPQTISLSGEKLCTPLANNAEPAASRVCQTIRKPTRPSEIYAGYADLGKLHP